MTADGTDLILDQVARSTTAEDNVEHIFTNDYPAGDYKIVVHHAGGADGAFGEFQDYALSWRLGNDPPALAPDFDGDFNVDINDLSIFHNDYGTGSRADADLDGDTDGSDFLSWQREYNGSGTAGALPPGTGNPGLPRNPSPVDPDPIPDPLSKVSFDVVTRPLSKEELRDGGASLEATDAVHEFFVSTESDIVVIGVTELETADGTIYQHRAGTNTAPASLSRTASVPALGVDSFITTPGNTSLLGGDMDDIDDIGEIVWFDMSNDGAVEDFLFARLTTEGGIFAGSLFVLGENGPEEHPFSFSFGEFKSLTSIPEPSTLMLIALGLPLLLRREPQW